MPEVPPCPLPLSLTERFVSVTLVLAGDTAETVDESLRLFGVYVMFCLFRVCVSGRAFNHAVSLRGSGSFQ